MQEQKNLLNFPVSPKFTVYVMKKKYDVDNLTQKYLLHKEFVAWNCNGSSVAPLTDYINNTIYQELIE